MITCLETPKVNEVLYFTDSKRASIKREEHRMDRRAARAIAVIKLARFSGNNVDETLRKSVEYVINWLDVSDILRR